MYILSFTTLTPSVWVHVCSVGRKNVYGRIFELKLLCELRLSSRCLGKFEDKEVSETRLA